MRLTDIIVESDIENGIPVYDFNITSKSISKTNNPVVINQKDINTQALLNNIHSRFKEFDKSKPYIINGNINLFDSDINDLHGMPYKCKGFYISDCHNLRSLEGGPTEIVSDMNIWDCPNLETFKGFPKKYKWSFEIRHCPKLETASLKPLWNGDYRWEHFDKFSDTGIFAITTMTEHGDKLKQALKLLYDAKKNNHSYSDFMEALDEHDLWEYGR